MPRLVVEMLEAISPRAARPSEIRKALLDKGIAMAAASIQFALGQLQARRAVEQVSLDKNVNCCCTSGPSTVRPEPGAFPARRDAVSPGRSALYDLSVRRLTALPSGFLRTVGHPSALAFG